MNPLNSLFSRKRLNSEASDFSFIRNDGLEIVSKHIYSDLDVGSYWFRNCPEDFQEEDLYSKIQEDQFVLPLVKKYNKMPPYMNVISVLSYPFSFVDAFKKMNDVKTKYPTLGYFSEIDKCWGIVENELFLWNPKTPELYKSLVISQKDTFSSANLIQPSFTLSPTNIKFFILCQGESKLCLIALSVNEDDLHSTNSKNIEFDLKLHCEYSAKSEKFTCLATTLNGQIFVGTNSGELLGGYCKKSYGNTISISMDSNSGSVFSSFSFSRSKVVNSPYRKLLKHEFPDRNTLLYAFSEDRSLHIYNVRNKNNSPQVSKIKTIPDVGSPFLSYLNHRSTDLFIESHLFPLFVLPIADLNRCLYQSTDFADIYLDQNLEKSVKDLSPPFLAVEVLPSRERLEREETLLGIDSDSNTRSTTSLKVKSLYRIKSARDIFTSSRSEVIVFYPECPVHIRINSPFETLVKLLKINYTKQDLQEFIQLFGMAPTLSMCLGLASQTFCLDNLSIKSNFSDACMMLLNKILTEFKSEIIKPGPSFNEKSLNVNLIDCRDFMLMENLESFILLTKYVFCPFWKKRIFKRGYVKNSLPDINFDVPTLKTYVSMIEKLYSLSVKGDLKLSPRMTSKITEFGVLDNIQRLVQGEMPIQFPLADENPQKRRRVDTIGSSSTTPSSTSTDLVYRKRVNSQTLKKMFSLESKSFDFLSKFLVRVREALKLIQIFHEYKERITFSCSISDESITEINSLTVESLVCLPKSGKLMDELLQFMVDSMSFTPYLQKIFFNNKSMEEKKVREMVKFLDLVSSDCPSFFSSQDIKNSMSEEYLKKAVKLRKKDERECDRLVNLALLCWDDMPLGISEKVSNLMTRTGRLVHLVDLLLRELRLLFKMYPKFNDSQHYFEVVKPLQILVYCELVYYKRERDVQEEKNLMVPEIMDLPTEFRQFMIQEIDSLLKDFEVDNFRLFYFHLKQFDVHLRRYRFY